MLILDNLLEIESNPEIAEFCFQFDNILMWPFVRSFLFQKAFEKEFALETAHATSESLSMWDWVKYFYYALEYNPLRIRSPFDIIYFAPSTLSRKIGGEYFNNLTDYYSGIYKEKSLVVEDPLRRKNFFPRQFENVGVFSYLSIRALLASKFNRPGEQEKESINAFVLWLQSEFPYSLSLEIWEECRSILSEVCARLPSLFHLFNRLFDNTNPKIIFVNAACYGNRAYLIKWAKDRGIKTAEIQHGFIGNNHLAYNYHPNIGKTQYMNYLPDYFLSFGEYWSNSIRLPGNKISIGNPYLSEMTMLHYQEIRERSGEKTIIFVSSGITPRDVVQFINYILEKDSKKDFSVILRPHPGEKPWVIKRYGELLNKGVLLDSNESVFETLSNADIVVGWSSTVLFDALAFKLPVILINTGYAKVQFGDSELFSKAENGEDIWREINSVRITKKKLIPKLWDLDWEGNFRRFIENEFSEKQ